MTAPGGIEGPLSVVISSSRLVRSVFGAPTKPVVSRRGMVKGTKQSLVGPACVRRLATKAADHRPSLSGPTQSKAAFQRKRSEAPLRTGVVGRGQAAT